MANETTNQQTVGSISVPVKLVTLRNFAIGLAGISLIVGIVLMVKNSDRIKLHFAKK